MDRSVDNVLINHDENLTDLISRTRYAHTLMIQRHFFHQIFLSFVVVVDISRTNESSGSIGVVVRFISFRINVVVRLEMEPGVVFSCHREHTRLLYVRRCFSRRCSFSRRGAQRQPLVDSMRKLTNSNTCKYFL